MTTKSRQYLKGQSHYGKVKIEKKIAMDMPIPQSLEK